MTYRRGLILLLASCAVIAPAVAQTPPPPAAGPARLRGTILSVAGDGLDLTLRTGGIVHVLLPATVRTTYVVAGKIADIQPNSFIGTAAILQPDGTLKALEVHVFPPSMRGTGEGFRPYDLGGAGSTMTNGTVGRVVGTAGRTLSLKYGDGEKTVTVPEDVPVVTFEPTDRSALKPGAKVNINGQRDADGLVTAAAINIGKDGLTPPM